MAITSGLTYSFLNELLAGIHDLDGTDTLKVALFSSSASLSPPTTTAYSTTNEITGTGYSAGGKTLTPTLSSVAATSTLDFADVEWTSSTFTARGCLIYNSSKSNRAIAIIDFGSDQSVTSGTFTIQWPAGNSANAIIRIIGV